MSSVQHLREFISARLTAAAEEIFTEFEKTIVQYEEEIDRQRRLLDVTWKPHAHLEAIELPAHYICTKGDAANKQSSVHKSSPDRDGKSSPDRDGKSSPDRDGKSSPDRNGKSSPDRNGKSSPDRDGKSSLDRKRKSSSGQKSSPGGNGKSSPNRYRKSSPDWNGESSLDGKEPEPLQVKEEPEEMSIGQMEELLVLKQEADIVMVTPPCEELDDSEPEPDRDLLLFLGSGVENQNQNRGKRESPDLIEISDVKGKPDGDGSPDEDVQCVSNPSETFTKCEIFEDVFRFNPNLKERFLSHGNQKPLICDVCGKRFSSLSTLKVHSKIHTGVGLWYCKICGRGFTRRDILRLHMRIHTGEKPYFCKTCGKSFRHSGTLTDHERTHTGEKPYTCNFCWKSFTYKRGLTVHLRTHTFMSL